MQRNLDTRLASLLSKDRVALVNLAKTDTEAASLLSAHLSGYATVRRFYDLRDNDISGSKPLERRREAANALVSAIESAGDCIRGGLFDPAIESEAVVPVDGLLVLLGETLPMLGGERRVFTGGQVFALMAVVEDLGVVSEWVRGEGGAVLGGAMGAYRGTGVGGSGMLTRSRSSVSTSASGSGSAGAMSGESWDILASSVMLGQSAEKGRTVGIQRGWDWRRGLDAVVGADVGSEEVLMLVRTALAREVARGWGGGLNW